MNALTRTTGTALVVQTINNEPRILDVTLAAHLGMVRPTNIRSFIEMNREELESFGGLHAKRAKPGPLGGRPGTAYYLNRQQALLVSILSRTERAKEMRAEVIRRFDEHERLVSRPQLANFANPAEAARVWAAQYDQQQIATREPAVRAGALACSSQDSSPASPGAYLRALKALTAEVEAREAALPSEGQTA